MCKNPQGNGFILHKNRQVLLSKNRVLKYLKSRSSKMTEKRQNTEPSNIDNEREVIKAEMVQKLLDIANAEIGYREKYPNKNNNINKYAEKHFPSLQGQFWCDVFVDSMYIEAYGRGNAEKMLGGFNAATYESKRNFERMGLWHKASSGYTPQPGDQIFYKLGDNKNPTDHTGIVVKVENGRVYTIEGNTRPTDGTSRNGVAVADKDHSLNASYIVGYGTPKWDVVVEPELKRRQELRQKAEYQENTVQNNVPNETKGISLSANFQRFAEKLKADDTKPDNDPGQSNGPGNGSSFEM